MCNTTPHTGYFPIPPIPLKESNEIELDRLDSFRGDIPMKSGKKLVYYDVEPTRVFRATLCSFYRCSNNLGDLGMGNHPLDSRERQSPDFKKGLLWQI